MSNKVQQDPDEPPLDLTQPVTLADVIKLLSATSGLQGEQLTKAFTDALKLTAPLRYIQIGEYDPKTPWHPVASEAHTLNRKCFQNGFPLNPDQMTNQQIDLLNAIDRSGRYCNRLVEVILTDEGTDEVVYIRYRNKTIDQQNELRGQVRSLEDMLSQIVTAQREAESELIASGRPATRRRRPYNESSDITAP